MSKTATPRRVGRTEKVSISLVGSDLAVLRRRARSRYGGNLSAVVAEAVQRIREEEGRAALLEWIGEAGKLTSSEREAIVAEWLAPATTRKRRRRAA